MWASAWKLRRAAAIAGATLVLASCGRVGFTLAAVADAGDAGFFDGASALGGDASPVGDASGDARGDASPPPDEPIVGSQVIATSPYDVAGTDTGFVVAWTEYPVSGSLLLRLAEVSFDGEMTRQLVLRDLPSPRRMIQVFVRPDGWDIFHQHNYTYEPVLDFERYDSSGTVVLSRELRSYQGARVGRVPGGYAVGHWTSDGITTAHVSFLDEDANPTGLTVEPEPALDHQGSVRPVWTGARILLAFPDSSVDNARVAVMNPDTYEVESVDWAAPEEASQSIVAFVPDPGGGAVLALQTRGLTVVAFDEMGAPRWASPYRVPDNRGESMDADVGVFGGRVGAAVQTDELVLPQIDLHSVDRLTGRNPVVQRLSAGESSYSSPAAAGSGSLLGVLYEGSTQSRLGPFLRVVDPSPSGS